MVPVALGTQTGGSVLRPASYCGVIGYKPTYNAFSRVGVKAAAEGLDTVGLIARSLDDIALVRAVLLGREGAPLFVITEPPRIGLTRTHLWDLAQPETVAAVEDAAERLAEGGAAIIDVGLPDAFAELAQSREIINDCERAIAMADEWHRHRELISERLRKIVQRGVDALPRDYAGAIRLIERCRAELDAAFGSADVLLTPCVRGEAPEGLHYPGDPSFQALWTLLHAPSLTLPTSIGPNGLPVGIQLVGRRHDDERLLAVSKWILAALGVRRRWRGHRARG
jgi:amidase